MPKKAKKGGGGGKTEEERLLYLQQRAQAEEEMAKKKEEILTLFLKVTRIDSTVVTSQELLLLHKLLKEFQMRSFPVMNLHVNVLILMNVY